MTGHPLLYFLEGSEWLLMTGAQGVEQGGAGHAWTTRRGADR